MVLEFEIRLWTLDNSRLATECVLEFLRVDREVRVVLVNDAEVIAGKAPVRHNVPISS